MHLACSLAVAGLVFFVAIFITIRVFIADDNRLLREGLVAMLAERKDFVVIGAAASGRKAVEQIKDLRPDVALIDIGMPAKDGIEVTQALHREAPEIKVIIPGMCDLAVEIMTSIEAGAAGYVVKEASFDTPVETIRAVHRGESFSSPQVTASLFSRIAELAGERGLKIPLSSVKLTPREVEIISQIAEGLRNVRSDGTITSTGTSPPKTSPGLLIEVVLL